MLAGGAWSEDDILSSVRTPFLKLEQEIPGCATCYGNSKQRGNLAYLLVNILCKDLGEKALKILRQTQIYMKKEIL